MRLCKSAGGAPAHCRSHKVDLSVRQIPGSFGKAIAISPEKLLLKIKKSPFAGLLGPGCFLYFADRIPLEVGPGILLFARAQGVFLPFRNLCLPAGFVLPSIVGRPDREKSDDQNRDNQNLDSDEAVVAARFGSCHCREGFALLDRPVLGFLRLR